MKLTPWTKRIAFIVLGACIITAVVCRESTVAATLSGGLLLLINPKDDS